MAKKYDDLRQGQLYSLDEIAQKNSNVYDASVRVVKTGNTAADGSPEVEVVTVEEVGATSTNYVNGKPQGTVFGADMVTATEAPELAGKWDLGVNFSGAEIDITTTGKIEIVANESVLRVGTGTASDGAAILTSKKRIRYLPGTPIFAKFTASFPTLAESNGDYQLGIGIGEGFDAGDNGLGLYQRRVSGALEYGLVVVRNGSTTYYPANGEMPPNPENLNIYRIEWGYLGIAPFNLYWRDTTNEKWVRMHRQTFSQDVTSITKPDLPVGVFAQNAGNTLDVGVGTGSYEAGTINGGKGFDPASRISTYERTYTSASATDELIFAFRNPVNVNMYDSIDSTLIPTTRSFRNSIASQLLEVGFVVVDNNKAVDIEVTIIDLTDLTDGTWTPVELGYSVLEVSEDTTPVLTDGRIIERFVLGKDDSLEKVITTLDILLPGQAALFTKTTTSASHDFSAYIKYQDLF